MTYLSRLSINPYNFEPIFVLSFFFFTGKWFCQPYFCPFSKSKQTWNFKEIFSKLWFSSKMSEVSKVLIPNSLPVLKIESSKQKLTSIGGSWTFWFGVTDRNMSERLWNWIFLIQVEKHWQSVYNVTVSFRFHKRSHKVFNFLNLDTNWSASWA